jgi:DNA-binding transcriptional ArsR family regulator
MSNNTARIPDYDLADGHEISSPAALRAIADQTRTIILDLLLERAATVSELAEAIGRPRSTIAHHVKVLVGAGLLRVVRTRRVRAIEERYYGRTARTFWVGVVTRPGETPVPVHHSALAEAAIESIAAHEADTLRTISRHARIPHERAKEFWLRAEELSREFAQLPRGGDTVYGFAAGLYPTDHPMLPEPKGSESAPATRESGSSSDAP